MELNTWNARVQDMNVKLPTLFLLPLFANENGRLNMDESLDYTGLS